MRIFEFWNKKNIKNVSSYVLFVIVLKTIGTQMLFGSVFFKMHEKKLLIFKNGQNGVFGG